MEAQTDTVTLYLPVLSGKLFAMPPSAGGTTRVGEDGIGSPTTNKIIVGKDGKTIVLDDSDRGWKYTYTLTIVK